ncbi:MULTISPECIES: FAD-dependent oxidoreductase [Actinosynnema]|uniref:FAD-dependent oxidoreductase n=1 Tax=Actinosynnema TaxID=40566 RepID=UPI0020A53B3A|nr:FAD-dependent oxidoreductase [Actinosynnema pretiosum]MCP2093876.1 2-polyprenyl-6-methoxyphenol hydroxylase [Actinosynnema pretiosum]
MTRTSIAIAGGGPAGMVLGLLLARAGVPVTVLEKHGDFLRDFRGDTVHASTLGLLDDLGLGPAFDAIPPRYVERMRVVLPSGPMTVADMRRLPGRHKRIAFVPQWDLLELLARAGRAEPAFTLVMDAEVTGLLREGQKVTGVRYRTPEGEVSLGADVVVAADGRTSRVRAEAGLAVRSFGVPMDVWWFRAPVRDGDELGEVLGRFGRGEGLVAIPRTGYFQCAFLIRKGTDARLRAEGVERFRERVAALMPALADRVGEIASLDDVKLLDVAQNRLRTWHRDGLLCVGDAAHAMSPVGGVGINLAIQDAVAAARLLAGPALRGAVTPDVLARLRRRRVLATAAVQAVQRVAQRGVMREPRASARPARVPLPLRLAQRFPVLQGVPAYLVSIGLRPEPTPGFAKRSPAPAR